MFSFCQLRNNIITLSVVQRVTLSANYGGIRMSSHGKLSVTIVDKATGEGTPAHAKTTQLNRINVWRQDMAHLQVHR